MHVNIKSTFSNFCATMIPFHWITWKIFDLMLQKKQKALDCDLEKGNGISCFGDNWLPKPKRFHITNTSGFFGPYKFQGGKRTHSFSNQSSFKSKKFSIAVLVEEIKPVLRRKIETERRNLKATTAFGHCGTIKILISKTSQSISNRRHHQRQKAQIDNFRQGKKTTVLDMRRGLSENCQKCRQSFSIFEKSRIWRKEENQPLFRSKFLLRLSNCR